MKKARFYLRCVKRKKEYAIGADGWIVECAGREVGVSENPTGAWTATDVKTGLAFPVDVYCEKRKDVLKWLKDNEPELKKSFDRVGDKIKVHEEHFKDLLERRRFHEVGTKV